MPPITSLLDIGHLIGVLHFLFQKISVECSGVDFVFPPVSPCTSRDVGRGEERKVMPRRDFCFAPRIVMYALSRSFACCVLQFLSLRPSNCPIPSAADQRCLGESFRSGPSLLGRRSIDQNGHRSRRGLSYVLFHGTAPAWADRKAGRSAR